MGRHFDSRKESGQSAGLFPEFLVGDFAASEVEGGLLWLCGSVLSDGFNDIHIDSPCPSSGHLQCMLLLKSYSLYKGNLNGR